MPDIAPLTPEELSPSAFVNVSIFLIASATATLF
jgi:hypothetical protein